MDNSKSFSVRTTVAAHARLADISTEWKTSQGNVLSLILEQISPEELDRLKGVALELFSPKVRRPTNSEIKAYLATLTPHERAAILAGETP